MELMSARYKKLVWSLEGLRRSGLPLVGYDGSHFVPGNGADDPGLFYIVPKIAHWFNLSIDQAVFVFFFALITGAGTIASFFLFKTYKSFLSRCLILPVIISLAGLSYFGWDVYIVSSCVVMVVIPAFLYFQKN